MHHISLSTLVFLENPLKYVAIIFIIIFISIFKLGTIKIASK